MAQKIPERFKEAGRTGNIQSVANSVSMINDQNKRDIWLGEALILASSNNQKEMCIWLVENGADVNTVDKYSVTPLMKAVAYPEIVRILVDAGAGLDIKSPIG